ncbi:hypothetical protein [Edaphobacter modestus]|uniref:Uncharacterized protein n=1 Tax=Edaphobacter modestus TaxID=388466 RepID=A0A4V2G436_9BACT|nr:hypothetical protein [Edaphobacter modestus]RZU39186.1 hypothetical protein BDD14_0536 [Edaphobacter modestus]
MNTSDIVLAIDAEITQLQKVKALLTDPDLTTKRKPSRPVGVAAPNKATSFNPVEFAKKSKRRTMSAEGRAKIAAAQKARWEKSKRVAKTLHTRLLQKPAKKAVTAKAVDRKTAQVKKARTVRKSKQSKAEASVTPAS